MAKKLFINAKTEAGLNAAVTEGTLNAEVAFLEEQGNEGIHAKGKTYQTIPSNGKDGQVLMASNGKGVWTDLDVTDMLSYGVEWKPNVADPVLTRIGNMNYHKSLPIQSGMKGCIYNPKEKKLVYWLGENDWRYSKTPKETTLAAIASEVSFIDVDMHAIQLTEQKEDNPNYYTDRYATIEGVEGLWQFKRGELGGGYVAYDLVYLGEGNWETIKSTVTADSKIYLHSNLNGYDGEVMVYVPDFYIKSWDEADVRRVRISPIKIDETWQHQPATYLAAYRDTVLNTTVQDMGYLSTLEANTAVSVANTNAYCRGGSNSDTNDADEDIFKRQLGKGRTSVTRANFRTYARKAGKEIMSYRQYKNILYWLWVIEYATFNSQATFNAELTAEGLHQGGMGAGLTNVSNWEPYNEYHPISPNGYTNEFGNGTAVKLIAPLGPTPVGSVYATRWRGIENNFGDLWYHVDGIIINLSLIDKNGVKYNEVYTTDNPELYSDSNWQAMEKVAKVPWGSGCIEEWDLGSTAEIIPRKCGGYFTQYKCDYRSEGTYTGLTTPLLGGGAASSSAAGLGSSDSSHGMIYSNANVGFRTSCVA